MPIVKFLTTNDLMRPIRNPTSSRRGAERPAIGLSFPIRRLCCRPALQELPRWSADHTWKANMNALAQAGVRRNRQKNHSGIGSAGWQVYE
jgi:hypothetical protein